MMHKLKLSIALFFVVLGVGRVQAQEFAEPFADFFSMKECFVITNSGEEIHGKLRGATQSRGFIVRLTLVDEEGRKHKFKAHQIQSFGIRPDAFTKLNTINEKTTSIRHAARTNYNNILDREWIYYDTQVMPRSKKKGMLQLLNPGMDEFIKVYYHPNGSKSMPIAIKGIPVVGGEERTFLVVKGDGDTQIVRKASFEKAYRSIFADVPEMLDVRNPHFRNFANHIVNYNELRYKQLMAEK